MDTREREAPLSLFPSLLEALLNQFPCVGDLLCQRGHLRLEGVRPLDLEEVVFQYGDVFWGVHPKPGNQDYNRSFKESRIDFPTHRFAENDMIELYPLQLQPGDSAAPWIFYTNALRHIPIQYDRSTILPLPLHLAKALEEYLFDA